MRDGITELTSRLGSALNTIGNTFKNLNIIDSTLVHVEKLSSELHATEISKEIIASNDSITSAIEILKQQGINLREQAQYLELRVRSQSSVVSAWPSTYLLTALFSIPSLGWNEPEKFPLYFAFAIPTTLAAFGIWASITQRQEIGNMMGRMGKPPKKF